MKVEISYRKKKRGKKTNKHAKTKQNATKKPMVQ